MTDLLNHALAHADKDLPTAIERLKELLKIKSISTDPDYRFECKQAADWLRDDLNSIGFDASVRPTDGHPVVVGHSNAKNARCLFYGHYDVQPVDPIELWTRNPFDPAVEPSPNGDIIRGRGSSDDKGQLMTFIEACRTWKTVTGMVPDGISLLLEGEEECGSPSIEAFLNENSGELTADLALICDTGLFDRDTPAVVTMLRGLLGEEILITGPDKDLHSGMYGGLAMNPIRLLARILAGLHDENGRVTIPGFYDGVPELPADIRSQWEKLGFDHARILGEVGLSEPAGESGRTPLEMNWSRPTCDVNGISGGYTGHGFKTVLPSQASAKVSFRLVGIQDPFKIRENFRNYVVSQLPPDCTVEFKDHSAAAACEMSRSNDIFEAARSALSGEWPNEAVYAGCGGSIPIAGFFQDVLGMDSVLIGFANEDDQIHSPNEKYDVESFRRGIRTWLRILAWLDQNPPETKLPVG